MESLPKDKKNKQVVKKGIEIYAVRELFGDQFLWKTSQNNIEPIVLEKLSVLIKNENNGGKFACFLTFPGIHSGTSFY